VDNKQTVQSIYEAFGTGEVLEIHDFKVLALMEGGNDVCAKIEIEFTVKATGKRTRDEELHLWTFDDKGLLSFFRHYVDTAKHIDASRP
jgi:hypothetical protein